MGDWSFIQQILFMAYGCDITKIKAIEKIAKIKGTKIEKSNFFIRL